MSRARQFKTKLIVRMVLRVGVLLAGNLTTEVKVRREVAEARAQK